MRTILCFVMIFFLEFNITAQNQSENYRQKLVGTDHKLEMVFIKGGNFQMGAKSDEWGYEADQSPKHQVKISAFWMSEVEITWDLYNLFVNRELDAMDDMQEKGKEVDLNVDGVTGATTPYVDMSFGMGVNGYPAISMTQLAAARFCQWLSALTGNFYRLPTEAEWEYACRAGSTSSYSYGDDKSWLVEYAWFKKNSRNSSHKVGEKSPNKWGLYDMHGNVAEWTLDHYDIAGYKASKSIDNDPVVMNPKTYPKVVRGGSWMDDPVKLRSASRMASTKKWKMRDPQIPKSLWWHTDAPFVGFRIVRPLKTPSVEEQKIYWNLKKD